MNIKYIVVMMMTFMLSTHVNAGQNRFTVGKYETPNGSMAKVLINTNDDGTRLIVACNNKVIGEKAAHGKIMVAAQDHDVVTKVKALGKNRLQVTTRNGWSDIFHASAIPKC